MHQTRGSRLVLSLALVLFTLGTVPLLADLGPYYFKGDPADQANKVVNDPAPGTATFDANAPTGVVPITQTGSVFTNSDYVGNVLGIYWTAPFSGSLAGVVDLQWYWSTLNPETIALGGSIEVTIFADPDFAAEERGQPEKVIGRAIVPLTSISATPTLIQSLIPVNGVVTRELLIQVVPQFVDSGNGVFVHYNATSTPSSFTVHSAPVRTPFPAAPQASGLPPRYKAYSPTPAQLAAGIGVDAGEPSIGVNWFTGAVMFQAMLQTLRVTFDDAACPTTPPATFENRSALLTSQTTFDPILYTDSRTGRTIVSQLLFGTTTTASAYSDDDGATWLPSYGAGIASGVDHQTLGGGPFHAPVPPGAAFPTAVYYCAQDIAFANCAVSLDGGRTYGPAVPIYVSAQCGGLHGHVKVGPDGTAYVPNKNCGGQQAVVVSENNGATWAIRKVPNSLAANSDPSVAIARNNRVYLGFADNENYPVVAVSDDKGQTWTNAKDVGKSSGIENVVFPVMVAGDDDRAALAYVGTTSKGDSQARGFPGVWNLYIATTYDGGNTWHNVNATPNDPVQRGPIWLGGGAEISRNLLDFMDATIDRDGRVIVGFADGCVGDCVGAPDQARGNSYEDVTAIVRQSGGRRMFSSSDPSEPTIPGAPTVTVSRNGNVARVSWSQANNGGAPVSKYSIYRRNKTAETLVGTVAGNVSSYADPTADSNTSYQYRVVATNSLGNSTGDNSTPSAPAGSSCSAPGITVLTDPTGDQTGAPVTSAAYDIQSVSISEPYFANGAQKVVFTLKVASLASLPARSQWRVIWNFPTTSSGSYYADMRTDDAGAVSFEYGEVAVTGLVVTSIGQPTRIGDADADSSYAPDGTIRIVLSTNKIGDAVAGDLIGEVYARTYSDTGAVQTGSRAAIDATSAQSSTYRLVGNSWCAPPALSCLEDDDPRIDLSSGWYSVINGAASSGHFLFAEGDRISLLDFDVPAGQFGKVTYHYAQSPSGGSAEVFIDGVSQGTISYLGTLGTLQAPQFGFSQTYGPLQGGAHRIEIRSSGGAAYLDKFCLENSSSNATPASGPGATTTNNNSILAGREVAIPINVPANATSLSMAAVATGGLVKIVLVDPKGLTLKFSDTANGVAVLDQNVTQGGLYIVKLINLGLGPVQVWSVVTPQVKR